MDYTEKYGEEEKVTEENLERIAKTVWEAGKKTRKKYKGKKDYLLSPIKFRVFQEESKDGEDVTDENIERLVKEVWEAGKETREKYKGQKNRFLQPIAAVGVDSQEIDEKDYLLAPIAVVQGSKKRKK
jgi:hypothetical protein